MKTTAAASTAFGAIGRNEPSPVATPLPPRNFSQTGNTWPMTANSAEHAAHESTLQAQIERLDSDVTTFCDIIRMVMATAGNLFSASNSSGRIPRAGDLRETLVAPMFPLPLWRTSSP